MLNFFASLNLSLISRSFSIRSLFIHERHASMQTRFSKLKVRLLAAYSISKKDLEWVEKYLTMELAIQR